MEGVALAMLLESDSEDSDSDCNDLLSRLALAYDTIPRLMIPQLE